MLRQIKETPCDTLIRQGIRDLRLASLNRTLDNCLKIVKDNVYTHHFDKRNRLEKLVAETEKLQHSESTTKKAVNSTQL